MEETKSFAGNHNLAYDDDELFGLPESSKAVDTSAFEELFGEDDSRFTSNLGPQVYAKTAVKKVDYQSARKKGHLLKVLSGIMTMTFVLFIFSIIIS